MNESLIIMEALDGEDICKTEALAKLKICRRR